MSSSTNIPFGENNITAPTPVNTPLNNAPISQGLSRPTVPDITEEAEPGQDDSGPLGNMSGLQSQLSSLVQNRLGDLIGKSSGYIENLPLEVKKKVEALKGVQVKQNDLQNEYKRECLELEKKYLNLAMPLYTRRYDLISGKAEPTQDEIDAGEKASMEDDEDYVPLSKAAADDKEKSSEDIKGIPEFWLTALRNHIGISELITERDEEALKFLTDITLSYLEEKTGEDGAGPGFILTFHFSANPFFTNDSLTKTYIYQKEIGYSGDFVYDKAVGCPIAWKEDKDLTKEFEIKKQRNKNTNRTRLVRKARPTNSFFNFFDPPVVPSDDDIETGKISEDELEEIEEKLEVDYQIGEDLKEKIIPRAIDYFTGKALEYDVLEAGSDDDDEDDDDEELGSDDDEDLDGGFEDSDSEPEARVPRRRGAKGRGAGQTNPEECKQQ